MSADLRHRLLLAAAEAYIRARGLDRADPPARAEDCARFLTHAHLPPQALDGVKASVPLADLLAAAKAVNDAARYRSSYETERSALDSWIDAWQRARDAMKDKSKPYKQRLAAVRRIMGLRGKRPDLSVREELADRYRMLIDDGPGRTNEKLAAIYKIAADTRKTPEAVRKALYREGIRNLPRM